MNSSKRLRSIRIYNDSNGSSKSIKSYCREAMKNQRMKKSWNK